MATYLVTGATRGIGRAVAHQLREHNLVLVGRDRETLDELWHTYPGARTLVVDLADASSIEQQVDRGDLPERLDGVVHCAGVLVRGRLEELSVDSWHRQLVMNVVAVAELTRVLLPALRAAGGTVVLVNSGAGLSVSGDRGVAYAASKFALRALADGLRNEEPGLLVTSIYPGRVATDMQRELRDDEGAEYTAEDYLRPESVAALIVHALQAPADAVVKDLTAMPTP